MPIIRVSNELIMRPEAHGETVFVGRKHDGQFLPGRLDGRGSSSVDPLVVRAEQHFPVTVEYLRNCGLRWWGWGTFSADM